MSILAGLSSQYLYLELLALVAVQRVAELVVSARHTRSLLAKGAFEAGRAHYPLMVALHTAFLGSCAAEVLLLDRPLLPVFAAAMLAFLLLSTGLRYWAISTLGERWTTRVFVLPDAEPVTGGPYRYLRHPNYLAVVIEIFALPLVHTAWLTAVLFSVANGLLLRARIRAEEEALAKVSRYAQVFGAQPRLLPIPRRDGR